MGKIVPKTQPINITLSIVSLKCIYFKLTEYAMLNKNPIEFEGGYEFAFVLNFKIQENDKTALVSVDSKLFEKQSENIKNELAEIKLEGIFSLKNFDEIIKKDRAANWQIPNKLIALCNNICIHALRGMYAIKLENTLYANAIMPLMNSDLFAPQKK